MIVFPGGGFLLVTATRQSLGEIKIWEVAVVGLLNLVDAMEQKRGNAKLSGLSKDPAHLAFVRNTPVVLTEKPSLYFEGKKLGRGSTMPL